MRYEILFGILFDLLREGRTTATWLAEKYGLSRRTIYRYVRRLASVLPLDVTRGRAGGITLADNYRLPANFLTKEEFQTLDETLANAYAQTADEKLLSAKRKLSAAKKAPPSYAQIEASDVLFLPAKGEEPLAEILRLLQCALKEKRVVRLLAPNELSRPVEPSALTVCGGSWSLYAYCRKIREFALIPLAEIHGVTLTEEYFQPRPSIL